MRLLAAIALLSHLVLSMDWISNDGTYPYPPRYFEMLGNRVVPQTLAELKSASHDDVKTRAIVSGVLTARITMDQRMAILRKFIEGTFEMEGRISRKRLDLVRSAISVLAHDGSPGAVAYFKGWVASPGMIIFVHCTSDSRTAEQIGVEALDALIVALAQSPSADARKLFYEIRARPPEFIKKRNELMRDLHYDYGDYNSGLTEPAR